MRVLATELVKRVNDETRRIRLAEQRLDRFEADMSNLEGTIAAHAAEMKAQMDLLTKSLKGLSDRMMVMENAMERVEKELAKRATKAEFKQIESYMNLMSPITSKFVTKEEMERAIDERSGKKY
jgi:hypothetical protein